jgi:hypothetical protein
VGEGTTRGRGRHTARTQRRAALLHSACHTAAAPTMHALVIWFVGHGGGERAAGRRRAPQKRVVEVDVLSRAFCVVRHRIPTAGNRTERVIMARPTQVPCSVRF